MPSQPSQPVKVESGLAEAVSVTAVPEASDALQLGPQSIAPPVTVPDPLPLFCTLSVCWTGLPPSFPPPQAARLSTSTATGTSLPDALVVMPAPMRRNPLPRGSNDLPAMDNRFPYCEWNGRPQEERRWFIRPDK
jgi:hypothetical protein